MKEVDAIKSAGQLAQISTNLRANSRKHIYADVFDLGLQLALRISDLLSIRYDMVDIENRSLTVKESKTKKLRVIRLNHKALAIIERRRGERADDVFIFQGYGTRAANTVKPLSRTSVHRAFAAVADELKINFSTHSMRKTRGYMMYSDGVDITKVSRMLNHNSVASTLAYIGVSKEEVQQTYDDYVL